MNHNRVIPRWQDTHELAPGTGEARDAAIEVRLKPDLGANHLDRGALTLVITSGSFEAQVDSHGGRRGRWLSCNGRRTRLRVNELSKRQREESGYQRAAYQISSSLHGDAWSFRPLTA